MQYRLLSLVAVFVSALLFASDALAQAQFNPRDFSGIWLLRGNSDSIGPNAPALTPKGIEAMKGRIPETKVPVPAMSNDPIRQCNPNGFPRLLFDSEPMEFAHLNDRVMQFFQWERQLREIWVDGRPLPSGENLENLGPAWYGHSVGQWEGDTLVVNTVGLDERAWLDEETGRPKSFHARIEERYRRIDPDTIEVQFTLFDPEYYTATWVGDKKQFKRMKPETYTYFGWKGLFGGITDAICAPVNEVEGYNKAFRDPSNK